jgi:hypothetical protein
VPKARDVWEALLLVDDQVVDQIEILGPALLGEALGVLRYSPP